MKNSKNNVQSIVNSLWVAVAGPRPTKRSDFLHRPKQLATEGGRRRFIGLQFRINEVISRIDELTAELPKTKDAHRKGRIEALLQHQIERGEMFLGRFNRMVGSDQVNLGRSRQIPA